MWHSQTLKYEATAIHESDNETEVAANSNIIKRKKYLNLQALKNQGTATQQNDTRTQVQTTDSEKAENSDVVISEIL